MGIFDRFPYSSTHEMNLDFMLGKATEIAESLQEVQDGLSDIDTHKAQAEQAAQDAAQAKQAAQSAAQNASASAGQAAQHKTDAEDAADRAEAASNLADNAVEQAQTSAQNASTAADGAIASATAAENRINAAAAQAQTDVQAAATQAQTNVQTAADSAVASATAAENRINALAESLPEDFTELNNEVTDLRSAITPLISNTKTINTLDGLTIYGAIIDYDSSWWGNPTVPDKKHIVVEIPLIDGADVETVLTITANAEQSCRFAGLVSAPTEVVNGNSVGTFSAVWSAPILVDAGQTYSGSIPSDVKYLIINTMQSYKDCIASFNITSSKSGDVEDLQTSVAELQNNVSDLNTLKNEHITINNLNSFDRVGGVVDYDSTWYGNANAADRKHVVVELQDGINVLNITAATNQDCRIAGLKNAPTAVVANTSIGTLSEFWSSPINIAAGTTLNTLIPSDVKYLVVNVLNSNNECVAAFNLDSTINGEVGEADNKANQIIHFTVGAHNVRDFSDGSGDGCPDNLVSVNLPLWKKHVSEWQNQDFLCMDEWYPYFDRSQTIDSYSEIYKQFYPYMYALPTTNPNRVIMSKYPGIFTNMVLYAIPVNTNIPCIICNLGGKNVCVVCWLQSAADSVAVRTEAYRAAIAYLAQFDVVVVAGDFNTEVGLEELTVFTEAGYTLGNGGYWGVINTWPANNPATPNDNIVSKGTILKMFTVGNNPVSSDHLPIKAEFCFNT